MVNGYPKAPLFRIDGERGFCIRWPRARRVKKMPVQRTSRRSEEDLSAKAILHFYCKFVLQFYNTVV